MKEDSRLELMEFLINTAHNNNYESKECVNIMMMLYKLLESIKNDNNEEEK